MTRQAVFYEQVTPVSSQRHAGAAVKTGTDYGFARDVNSVPVTAVEFSRVAPEYAIVFVGDEDAVMPMAVLGVLQDHNHYVDETGKWNAGYVPAFVRRYPFVFSSGDDGTTFTLCIDETFSGYNEEGRGERLFDADGERTQYLTSVLGFQQGYQAHFNATRAFCRKLKELDLLESVQANFRTPEGKQHSLTGLLVISQEKLKALPDEKLAELVRGGELELVYLHLHSLRHITAMAVDLKEQAGTEKAAGKATTDVPVDMPASAPGAEAETEAGPESGEKTH